MQIEEIDGHTLSTELESDSPPVVIDVREDFERQIAFIDPSLHIPKDELPDRVQSALSSFDRPVVLYCAKGQRSQMCAVALTRLGYTHVRSLRGGIESWQRSTRFAATAVSRLGPWRSRCALLSPSCGDVDMTVDPWTRTEYGSLGPLTRIPRRSRIAGA